MRIPSASLKLQRRLSLLSRIYLGDPLEWTKLLDRGLLLVHQVEFRVCLSHQAVRDLDLVCMGLSELVD